MKQNDARSDRVLEDALQVEFMSLVFTCMPGERERAWVTQAFVVVLV